MKRIILVGVAAGVLLLGFYFGILALLQGIDHAVRQSADLWYWLAALAIGFGVQAGLFDFIRRSLKQRRAAVASVSASGGVSAGSMVACCVHHLSDVLPLIGLSGLAAFLAQYQVFFLVIGVVANVIGVAVMLETVQRHGLCPVLARLRLDLGLVKKGALIAAAPVLLAAFFLMM